MSIPRRAVLCLLVVLFGVPEVSAEAPAKAAPELSEVLAKLAQIEALSAHFREEKRMPLLAEPMISEGTLHYAKPRLLVRHTEKPRKQSVLLRGDTLSFGDGSESQRISLSSQPALRVLVDTIVSVLAGDRAALEQAASVSIAPHEGGYRIKVVPKDAKMKRLVQVMSFDGKGAMLTRMEILDASGDTAVTTFSGVSVRKAFSEAERARLFRVGK
jgi:outer membrane lipoprotein-sorting protein